MDLLLLTKKGCELCERVKAAWPGLRWLDIETPEGMAEMAYSGLETVVMPVLIVNDEEVFMGEDVVNILEGVYGQE